MPNTIQLPVALTERGLELTCDKCPRTFKTQGALNGHLLRLPPSRTLRKPGGALIWVIIYLTDH